ncbi:uncharacterized protein LOC107632535 [Arachis ipaensis]|uniref:uncharacterized protein LOC107632535 n=1 Tax=Arachis ipaensis TaxID=130454 RepID=UPI0007AF720E|nr:uncharacterized protein LOC107632535 [Arachis ipaensis]XP_025637238.1 uncharacterized protein LOC112732698 [Arachis hypogaea]
MRRQHRPDIAILLETKCSGDTAKRVIHNLDFSYSILEEAQGFVGGIWICWNRPDINITTIEKHSQYLHVKIQTQSEKERFLTAVYASPQSQNRRELWPKILNIANQTMRDWLIAGDFNEIKDNSEKKAVLLLVTEIAKKLIAEHTEEEIKNALYSIRSFKAPGSDGFSSLIYKNNWDLMKGKLYDFINCCWQYPDLIKQCNNTLLTLVPKLNSPEFVSQFRPIALFNVSYKVLTKILVERIKPHLNDRIAVNQSSFIPERKIQDNILIAKEMMHTMRCMKEMKQFMADA